MEQSVRAKISELRNVCERDIAIQQLRVDDFANSFRNSLQLIKKRSEQTAEHQVNLGKLKAQLREAEDNLVKALSVKTRKEAKQMALADSISITKAKVEELRRTMEVIKARKDEYTAVVSKHLEELVASEEKIKQEIGCRDEIQVALAWYNKVLGFQIEGGHGVKFAFTNINKKFPTAEYSFTIHHANDTYTLIDCNPCLDDMEELVHELNKTNDLFRLVRIMREKFQEAPGLASFSHNTHVHQDSTTIPLSAPVASVSTDSRSDSPALLGESDKDFKKASSERGAKWRISAPRRQSPRLRTRNAIEN
ncbi:hypothetical protein Nepgr_025258 [Nepenthes gracilis]|uniref:Kinetochore protein SPC25 n=1 Tax=Nepenthes gracilis TaxID=150966 RepID=A0AAD3Y0W2_NEPGR|nr:hypothetical protein Nepgr_025258 [Nepenthes gracilis]